MSPAKFLVALVVFCVLSGLLFLVGVDQYRQLTNYDKDRALTLFQRREMLSKAIAISATIVLGGLLVDLL